MVMLKRSTRTSAEGFMDFRTNCDVDAVADGHKDEKGVPKSTLENTEATGPAKRRNPHQRTIARL
jgi:hypothetical protein